MRNLAASLFFLLLVLFACAPAGPEFVPLPTSVCVQTVHHSWPVPKSTVYVKYNTDEFPGYEKPPSFYDTSFHTDNIGRGCLAPLPEGRHWLVAYGFDSLVPPFYPVFGSLKIEITLGARAKLDTILYVTE